MNTYYVLENGVPRVASLVEWARWFEDSENRRIDHTQISDDVFVSTVFLGMNHQHGDGPPLVFETVVFGPNFDSPMWRTPTMGEAKRIHHTVAQAIRDGRDLDGIE